ncbi:MAG: ABC-type multidrug transport system, ATPase component [Gemmatimonadetes bacterium]|nr:ABC-type multidrug transport system, ATPase component [Gemmatimonadota bacterium]
MTAAARISTAPLMVPSPFPTALNGGELAVCTTALTKYYGWHPALKNVGLQVPVGSVYLLVGPNGAGKSTTIKILLDMVRPSGGAAHVFDMNSQRHAAVVRANVGYVPEQLNWGYGWMKVGRLLEHHSRYFPNWDDSYAKHLADAFELRLDRKLKTLSKGQGRRVHLAMALAHRPPLLVLDEPTDGLDPVMRDDTMRVLIDHLAETPTTVLLSTHHVSEVETLADHIGVIRNGELCAQMPIERLRRGLLRYRADVPDGWQGASLFGDAVLRRNTTRNEIEWTVWGEEAQIAGELAMSGATVRDATPISLHDATLALLTPKRAVR